LTRYGQGTNGLVYQQLVIDLPALSADEQVLLPLYSALVSELGAATAITCHAAVAVARLRRPAHEITDCP